MSRYKARQRARMAQGNDKMDGRSLVGGKKFKDVSSRASQFEKSVDYAPIVATACPHAYRPARQVQVVKVR